AAALGLKRVGVIDQPVLCAGAADEEAIVPGRIGSAVRCAAEDGIGALGPACRIQRVAARFECEEPETVAIRPTAASRVREEELSAGVDEGFGALVDGGRSANLFPAQRR